MIEQDVRPNKIRRFFKETIRVLRITKKPNKEEFKSIVKVKINQIGELEKRIDLLNNELTLVKNN